MTFFKSYFAAEMEQMRELEKRGVEDDSLRVADF